MARLLALLSVLLCGGCPAADGGVGAPDALDSSATPDGDISESLDAEVGEDAPEEPPADAQEVIGGDAEAPIDALTPPPDALRPTADAEEDPVEWGLDQCPATGEGIQQGFAVGDQLAPLTFSACDGSSYALDSTCGASATWLFMAHAWCGDCQEVAAFSDEIGAYFEGHDVAIVHVLVHSPLEALPVEADCADWQTLWGFEKTALVFDPWFASVLLADTGQTAQSVFLNADRVIVDKLHTADEAEIIGAIQQILSH